jgi:hypothetical protein
VLSSTQVLVAAASARRDRSPRRMFTRRAAGAGSGMIICETTSRLRPMVELFGVSLRSQITDAFDDHVGGHREEGDGHRLQGAPLSPLSASLVLSASPVLAASLV